MKFNHQVAKGTTTSQIYTCSILAFSKYKSGITCILLINNGKGKLGILTSH